MDVDVESLKSSGELKIKGQAEVERRKSKWEIRDEEEVRIRSSQIYQVVADMYHLEQDPRGLKNELEKRENELKEKALRNKVVRTLKGSNGPVPPRHT